MAESGRRASYHPTGLSPGGIKKADPLYYKAVSSDGLSGAGRGDSAECRISGDRGRGYRQKRHGYSDPGCICGVSYAGCA